MGLAADGRLIEATATSVTYEYRPAGGEWQGRLVIPLPLTARIPDMPVDEPALARAVAVKAVRLFRERGAWPERIASRS